MTEQRDHKCPRCGAELKVVTVQKPTKKEFPTLFTEHSSHLPGYMNVEEVADCPRCTGGY